jgi:mannose-6-phosphate isomerase-like protein (cupin superfamily)
MTDVGRGGRVTLKEALEKVALAAPKRFANVFAHGTLEVELYAPVGDDLQTPHSRDEVYLVARGNGLFRIAEAGVPFGPGDFLFVPAGVEHRFERFTEDFLTWVFFYGPVGGEARGADRA